MLNATFEMFIPHYIMEYLDNLCSPCLLREALKKVNLATQDYYVRICAL